MIRLLLVGAIAIPLGLDLYLPVPEDNPLTRDKVALGGQLFRDVILSRDRTHACASCHDPDRAFTDGRPVAIGARGRTGIRNAPSLINRAYGRSQFWDGRAASLEKQVSEPIGNPNELDFSLNEAVDRLRASRAYRARFMSVFGRPPTGEDLSRAIASYMRTILAGNSPSDRYAQGDTRALSAEARRGLEIFRGKGRCSTCHAGPTLTDEDFHNTGVAWRDERWTDTGRFAVTRVNTDRGAFKTPTLRQIARTAPYMHDGSLPTLDAVIEYYDRGGNPAPSLDVEIKPLHLTPGEKQAVLAFLRALTGEVHEARVSR